MEAFWALEDPPVYGVLFSNGRTVTNMFWLDILHSWNYHGLNEQNMCCKHLDWSQHWQCYCNSKPQCSSTTQTEHFDHSTNPGHLETQTTAVLNASSILSGIRHVVGKTFLRYVNKYVKLNYEFANGIKWYQMISNGYKYDVSGTITKEMHHMGVKSLRAPLRPSVAPRSLDQLCLSNSLQWGSSRFGTQLMFWLASQSSPTFFGQSNGKLRNFESRYFDILWRVSLMKKDELTVPILLIWPVMIWWRTLRVLVVETRDTTNNGFSML